MNQELCAMCEKPATQEYESIPVCDSLVCGFKIQEAKDYLSEVGDR